MSIYDEMQDIATGLLNEFKQGLVQYQPISRAGGTVDEPGAIVAAAKVTLAAAVRGVKYQFIDKTNIVASDLQLTCAVIAGGFDMAGQIFVDNVQHKILKIVPIPAAGTPVAYTIIFRK